MSTFDGPVNLPKDYRGDFTIANLFPGDVIFASPSSILQDQHNRGVFVDMGVKIRKSMIHPNYKYSDPDDVGIMRVYEELGGAVIDGYVIDISHVDPRSISVQEVYPLADSREDALEITAKKMETWSRVLGIGYTDLEGAPRYTGHEQFRDGVDYIRETMQCFMENPGSDTIPRHAQIPERELLE